MTAALALDPTVPERARRAHAARGVVEECYLVDPASSHMPVSYTHLTLPTILLV